MNTIYLQANESERADHRGCERQSGESFEEALEAVIVLFTAPLRQGALGTIVLIDREAT